MEKEVQHAKAKEKARRILLNQNEPGTDILDNGEEKVAQKESVAATKVNVEEEKAIASSTVTTTSNILNPPILQDFLKKVRKRRAPDK